LKTDSKPASKLKQPAQPVSPAAQKDSGIYIKISIYSYPSALVFIDHQKVKDSRGLDVFTPVKDLRVKPGMHTIKLIARDDPSKTWWVQHIFDRDNMIYVDSRAGDW